MELQTAYVLYISTIIHAIYSFDAISPLDGIIIPLNGHISADKESYTLGVF